ncbi:hypothetical protein FGU46_03110 [Methanobacterium sp. CWC-01]|uniref:hypothetical protein n=1 Tax=Methanobacterium aridiramus TaxID=2584467 RepID=UPI0025765104|nr:hypothetical protein [Methanobacterium sp. CWC-01]WJI09149.1 hypothetical protein FGU46_03110 [Methanobacterium sp. CWC-01]
MLGNYRCPNLDCPWNEVESEEGFCPECGSELKKVGIREGAKILGEKKKHPDAKAAKARVKEAKKMEKAKLMEEKDKIEAEKQIQKRVIDPDQTDDQIKDNIMSSLDDLAGHEAGTKWMRIGTLLSFNSTEQMIGAGFKAIIDQNKILIRQNELLRRQNETIIQELKNRE